MAELDAAESKRRKTEQVEMAKEACLCLVTYKKLIVIKLSNLKEEVDVIDWTCLPPPRFELCLDLPEPDMCPFEFDSKIYMAPSSLPPEIHRSKSISMANLVPWPIFEIKFEEGRFARTGSLDGAPFPFDESYIANTPGSGDVYFYINLKPRVKDSSGFYVLCSGSRVWKPLMAPPAISFEPLVDNTIFVLDNNLFFLSSTESDSCLARFDPIKETWMDKSAADNNLSNFLQGRLISGDDHCCVTYSPHISVSLPGLGSSNYTICLTHEYVMKSPHTHLDKVLAILVNHQNGLVALYQYLDVGFEGIQPPMEESEEPGRFNFVDLGNGKLCAIHSAELLHFEPDSSKQCISVFTLSMLKDVAALQLDSGAPPMEQDFLQVTVHRKSVFTMENCGLTNYMRHAFVWPPTKGGRFQHRTTPF
ncbi:hypothetical protein HN51_002480 [Arachis hypogaea]|nr:uncharacterized protein DS421_1g24480 [Arachis hypogaea]